MSQQASGIHIHHAAGPGVLAKQAACRTCQGHVEGQLALQALQYSFNALLTIQRKAVQDGPAHLHRISSKCQRLQQS